MQAVYTFQFLDTISAQLKSTLDSLSVTALDDSALTSLSAFQRTHNSRQGVYLMYYGDLPVYLGKANDVWDRLTQHRQKLSGRNGIDMTRVGYKALLLDASMSTAANEDILIAMFKRSHNGMWNGRGFGPKDPGQERDTTKPSWFDQKFPIVHTLVITDLADMLPLGTLLLAMKARLPYVFRYEVPEAALERQIDLSGVDRAAESLLQHIVDFLGAGWKGAVISYGMVLYENTKKYPHGRELLPRVLKPKARSKSKK